MLELTLCKINIGRLHLKIDLKVLLRKTILIRRLIIFVLLLVLAEILLAQQVYTWLQVKFGPSYAPLLILASLIAGVIFGKWVIRAHGLRHLQSAREQLGQGALPSGEIINGLLLMAAGVFFIVPGYLSDAFGVLLMLLAPLRKLLAGMLSVWLGRAMAGGKFRMYQSGVNYQRGGFYQSQSKSFSASEDIIDVTPIEPQERLR